MPSPGHFRLLDNLSCLASSRVTSTPRLSYSVLTPLHQQPCGAHSKVPSLDERDRAGDSREMRKIEGEPFLSAGASPGVYVASAVIFKQDGISDTRGRAFKTQTSWHPPPLLQFLILQGWSLRICMSIKFPGDSDAAGLACP